MSKSLGNVVDPVDILEVNSCDALRFTLATGKLPPALINVCCLTRDSSLTD